MKQESYFIVLECTIVTINESHQIHPLIMFWLLKNRTYEDLCKLVSGKGNPAPHRGVAS